MYLSKTQSIRLKFYLSLGIKVIVFKNKVLCNDLLNRFKQGQKIRLNQDYIWSKQRLNQN